MAPQAGRKWRTARAKRAGIFFFRYTSASAASRKFLRCHHAIMPSCHHAIMPSCHHAIMPSCHHAIMPSCHHAIMPSCHHAIMPSCHHAIMPSCHHAIMPSCHHAIMPSCHHAIWGEIPRLRRAKALPHHPPWHDGGMMEKKIKNA